MNRTIRISAGIALAAIAVPASLMAQTTAKEKKDFPKSELFVGYSYLRAVPTLADGNRLVTLNGGTASLAYNFNRYFGLVTDFTGYADSELRLSGPGASPTRIAGSGGSAYTFLFGPRLSYRAHDRFTPFVQVLGGGAYATAVTLNNCTVACTPLPEQGSFAMTAGGGLDIKLTKHVALRAVQAEYLMTRFADVSTSVRGTQNDMRLSAGIVFRFGGHPASAVQLNRAPMSACSVDKPVIYAGSNGMVGVHARAVDADSDLLNYTWTSADGTVSGSGADVQWDLTGSTVGSHVVKLKVDDGRGGASDCSAEVMVAAMPNRSPSLTCSVTETALQAGQIAHLTATASDPDGDPLQYAWTSNTGSIRGEGAAASLQTVPGDHAYMVRVSVTDGRGGATDCSMNFNTQRSPEQVKLEERLSLRSIYFPTAEPTVAQPGRGLVASQHQTLLSLAADFTQYLKAEPTAHLILEGHADPRGSAEYNQRLSELRVALTKQYLVEHGIAADSIEIKARGDQQNLSDAQVKEAIQRSPELTEDARRRLLLNMRTIILASNRRVDVALSTTNQHSVRQYPFNAADSVTLLSEQKPGSRRPSARKGAAK